MEKRYQAFVRRELNKPETRAIPKKKRFKIIKNRWRQSQKETLERGRPKESTLEIVKESKLLPKAKKVVDDLEENATFPIKQITKELIPKSKLLDVKEKDVEKAPQKDGKGFKGENHAIGLDNGVYLQRYSFAGPGTKIKQRLARGDNGIRLPDGSISKIDSAAKIHDIEYQNIFDNYKKTKGNFNPKDVRVSDNKFIEKVKRANEEPNLRKVILSAFSAKKFAEDKGLISPKKFVITGGT